MITLWFATTLSAETFEFIVPSVAIHSHQPNTYMSTVSVVVVFHLFLTNPRGDNDSIADTVTAVKKQWTRQVH